MKRLAPMSIAVVAAALGLFAYVQNREGPRVPVYRFVDPTLAIGASEVQRTDKLPIAALSDDVRYVLDTPARAPLFYKEVVPVPANAHVSIPVMVPGDIGEAARLALVSQLKTDGGWYKLPTTVGEPKGQGWERVVTVELALPEKTAGKTIGIHVEGVEIDPERIHRNRTAEVSIPSSASLGFAIGVFRAAWQEGPVAFRVKACRVDDCKTIFDHTLDPRQEKDRGWHDFEVSLAELAGRSSSFEFETEVLSDAPGAFSFPHWANPTVYAPSLRSQSGVNVILLSIDTLSAKHLDLYGYPFTTMPFVAKQFGEAGTVFDSCVAAATTTPQSHMSMLTGVQPCVHGIVTGMEQLSPRLYTLAEALRNAGYETGAVTEDGWLGYEHGFGRGFNVYSENKSPDIMAPQGQVDYTLTKARRWLERNGDKRFFLFLHTFQVHDPYAPPAKYSDLFLERNGEKVSATSSRTLRDEVAYDQEIRYTDDELASFFGFLREKGLLEKTVFILTSDHGEEFYEHGLWGHGADLYQEVTRVPLLMTGPGVAAGRRTDATVGHVDLMPTILALANVNASGQSTGVDLLGTKPPGDTGVRFTESRVDIAIGPNYQVFPVTPPAFLAQSGPLKLSRYRRDDGFEYRAFDLAKDPQERDNRIASASPSMQELKGRVDSYEVACAMLLQALGEGEASKPLGLDPANEDKLRALGYLK